MTAFAAFVVAPTAEGIAAVQRKDGSLALPGGKVDPGETPRQAASREAREEGWAVTVGRETYRALVGGRLVVWFAGSDPQRVAPRPGDNSSPTVAQAGQLLTFGNDKAVPASF
jgi:8-oxo-dGTP pyrophosphatase MutT (NUDIX family)